VGHGRGAALGATLADLLNYAGYDAKREYYVNDAGRQMSILAVSIWLRYLELYGAQFAFPSSGYKGEYVIEIAQRLRDEFADSLVRSNELVFENIPADLNEAGEEDKEAHIDALIQRAKTLLGNDYDKVFQKGLEIILADIRDDLQAFGVTFDEWFSEKRLQQSGAIQHAINKLKAVNGHLYERNGAVWFNSIPFGDDKDRVVIRENGQTTYFASDLAYLLNKFERGYERVLYILGADHHGYVARLKAAAQALGINPDKVDILLVQFAALFRGKEKVPMSTRSGSFVTLRELREEVGKDAARFFYIMRKSEQHMDFDLELAKSKSNENPVYYIQYAHARICSVFRQLQQRKLVYEQNLGLNHLDFLNNEYEKTLLACLARYPELIETAAKNYEPHLVANYLRELATDLHGYYNAHQFIVEDERLRNARLCLVQAVQQVLVNGLSLLGLNAPEQM
jgi:arginyl-tRNA synthetase